ncbi:MAG: ferritin-like domain-containing protein [Verrucomicrobia bacterium]|nr:ferritin-like domain-containing protein [Verrucomicrobiota bacterium]
MSKISSLSELLVDEIKDLYSAENQLLKALPKMARAASAAGLKAGFTEHLAQTREHAARLERAARLLDESPKGKTCHAMQGLVEEGAEAIELEAPDAVRDAALIGAAQRVEHYEIAAYGTAHAFALAAGEPEVAALLEKTLQEEGDTDKKLTALSAAINEAANRGEASDETDDKKPRPATRAATAKRAKQ